MRICFLLGSADISGGTHVIFEHCLHLKAQGHEIVVTTLEPMSVVARNWHRALGELRFETMEALSGTSFDLAVATWWKTVYELARIDAVRYCYFVQSIESWFYPDREVALRNLVNSTYLLSLPVVTEAKWIREHLRERFASDALLAPNGCDKSVYKVEGEAVAPRDPERLRVLVEGPFGVDFKNVARTIALLRRSRADEIWLLTISDMTSYPGVSRVFSRIPNAETAAVYRSCDVLVKLSLIEGMFGPPLEMFHCGGTAIVYDVTGHDEYIVDGDNALVVPSGNEPAVIEAVNRLKTDGDLLRRLKRSAVATARDWPDWRRSSETFAQALETIVETTPRADRQRLECMTREFFQQYVRAETVLNRLRRKTARQRLSNAFLDLAGLVGRAAPAMKQKMPGYRARLFEETAQPEPRTKI